MRRRGTTQGSRGFSRGGKCGGPCFAAQQEIPRTKCRGKSEVMVPSSEPGTPVCSMHCTYFNATLNVVSSFTGSFSFAAPPVDLAEPLSVLGALASSVSSNMPLALVGKLEAS